MCISLLTGLSWADMKLRQGTSRYLDATVSALIVVALIVGTVVLSVVLVVQVRLASSL